MTQNNFNNSIETGIIKKYEDLTISDDFMFGIIMRQAKYCKPFLETVLDIKIKMSINKNYCFLTEWLLQINRLKFDL